MDLEDHNWRAQTASEIQSLWPCSCLDRLVPDSLQEPTDRPAAGAIAVCNEDRRCGAH
jgi:hypothetical protein